MSFYPFVPHEISVLVELILGHLRYLLTDVPPQPNSPPDNVFNLDRKRRDRAEKCCPGKKGKPTRGFDGKRSSVRPKEAAPRGPTPRRTPGASRGRDPPRVKTDKVSKNDPAPTTIGDPARASPRGVRCLLNSRNKGPGRNPKPLLYPIK